MAQTRNTKHDKTSRTSGYLRSGTSMRRTLRREAPSTIGLLADERDFAAMRRYRTFTFDDHTVYLQQVEGLLKALAAQGMHATVALFDPDAYAEFCTESGIAPDAPASRSRFTAEIASAGATVAYSGQPIDTLIPLLVGRAVRQATWEYATMTLADLGACADCGQDVGRAAFDRASHLLLRMLETADRAPTTSSAALPPRTSTCSPSCTPSATPRGPLASNQRKEPSSSRCWPSASLSKSPGESSSERAAPAPRTGSTAGG